MLKDQTIMELVPFTWSVCQQERTFQIFQLKNEFEQILDQFPQFSESIYQAKRNLATEGPYYELIQEFQEDGVNNHKLYSLLSYIHFQEGEPEGITNLKQFLKPQKLQKLICDIYRINNKRILDYQAHQIIYSKYMKLSISTIKKTINTDCLNQNLKNFVSYCATKKCPTLSNQWKEFEVRDHKYNLLALCLKRIKSINCPKTNCLKEYWNQQQIIMSFILFCLLQCEELIAINLGEYYQPIRYEEQLSPETKSNTDFTWNYNGFSKIRDYFPKLACKLNKRMQSLKQLPIYTEQERIQIFAYTQSLLGYQTNIHINLTEEIKQQIQSILDYEQSNLEPGLVILVANAKLYTQLMFSLM